MRDRNDLRMLFNHEQFMREGFSDSGITASSGGGKVGGGDQETVWESESEGKMGPPADKSG